MTSSTAGGSRQDKWSLMYFHWTSPLCHETFLDFGSIPAILSPLCLSMCSALPPVPFFLCCLPKPQGLVQVPLPEAFLVLLHRALSLYFSPHPRVCPVPGNKHQFSGRSQVTCVCKPSTEAGSTGVRRCIKGGAKLPGLPGCGAVC